MIEIDAVERQDLEQKIKKLEVELQKYVEIATNSPIGIISCDTEGNITFVNNMVVKLLGSPNAEETKKINLLTFPLLVESGFSEKLKECIQTNSHTKYELQYTSKWGKKIWLSIHNMPQIYGDEPGAQVIIDDITERKNLEHELTTLSFTDTLTNAYNRRFFRLKLEEEIKYRQEVGGSFSLIMLDLDHFKNINDRYGHDCGDFVLTTITAELMNKIRKSDILTRWGGEEFIILLSGTAYHDALQIAENLRKCVEKICIPDVESVSASFGVAGFCTGDTIDMIIQNADNMLYTAKSSGRNCVK